MKVALLNTFDTIGGAARAAYRLHRGLENGGVDSKLFVQAKFSADQDIYGLPSKIGKTVSDIKKIVDSLPALLYLRWKRKNFSPAGFPSSVPASISAFAPDIIHLHWINRGFISIGALSKIRQPIVWTLHDMWPFSGGCHYDGGCGRWQKECGYCPVLGSGGEFDLSAQVLQAKIKGWKELNLTIVSPSNWLAQQAKSSTLFAGRRIEVIPNGIDTDIFRPMDKKFAKAKLKLDPGASTILCGASALHEERKGMAYLTKVIGKIEQQSKIHLLVLGGGKIGLDLPPDRVTYLGKVERDEQLAEIYSAADVLIAPSLQENLSNMVMESLSCNTPVAAFAVGGMSDMIDQRQKRQNGYLAKPFDIADMAQGILWLLQNHDSLGQSMRGKVLNNFSIQRIVQRHIKLYESCV